MTYYNSVLAGVASTRRVLTVAAARDRTRLETVGIAALAASVSLDDRGGWVGESGNCESRKDIEELHSDFDWRLVLEQLLGFCRMC